jgi:hypothetical protein
MLRQANRIEKGLDSSIEQFYAERLTDIYPQVLKTLLSEPRRMAVRAVDAARLSGMA